MSTPFEDQATLESAMSDSFSDEEHDALRAASRAVARQGPAPLRVNCETGEMVSPSGAYGDSIIAVMEGEYRRA